MFTTTSGHVHRASFSELFDSARAEARAVLQNQDYSDSLLNRPRSPQGLLTASQGEGLHLHWLARLLAYVCTAFLVACVNASLVGILSGARLASRPAGHWPDRPTPAGPPSRGTLAIQSWTLRQEQARAPPIQVAVPSWNLVGGAH